MSCMAPLWTFLARRKASSVWASTSTMALPSVSTSMRGWDMKDNRGWRERGAFASRAARVKVRSVALAWRRRGLDGILNRLGQRHDPPGPLLRPVEHRQDRLEIALGQAADFPGEAVGQEGGAGIAARRVDLHPRVGDVGKAGELVGFVPDD